MIDFLLDSEFDLVIENGDIKMGNSDLQHQQLLLLTGVGEWREKPTAGVDLLSELDDEAETASIENRIKRAFEADGMTVNKCRIQGTAIEVEAFYK